MRAIKKRYFSFSIMMCINLNWANDSLLYPSLDANFPSFIIQVGKPPQLLFAVVHFATPNIIG
jgi:hypothetical protein